MYIPKTLPVKRAYGLFGPHESRVTIDAFGILFKEIVWKKDRSFAKETAGPELRWVGSSFLIVIFGAISALTMHPWSTATDTHSTTTTVTQPGSNSNGAASNGTSGTTNGSASSQSDSSSSTTTTKH